MALRAEGVAMLGGLGWCRFLKTRNEGDEFIVVVALRSLLLYFARGE